MLSTFEQNSEELNLSFESYISGNNIENEEEKTWKFTEMAEIKEDKQNAKTQELEHIDAKVYAYDFMKPLIDDYMNCEAGYNMNCRAIKRISHLLDYCHKLQRETNDEKNFLMHDYLLQFTKYTLSFVMEDWYHCKKIHFIHQKDIENFKNNANISCMNGKFCAYLRRYQRDRSKENFDNRNKEIDFNDIILMDQLDSIHSYIFHSLLRHKNMRLQNGYFLPYNIIENDSDSDSDIKEQITNITFEHDLWENKPNSISECNV
eukprot:483730_1